jgi:Uma2 family endonuclease
MSTPARWTTDDPPPFGTRMSDEEWEALGEDVEGELVDGVLVEEEMPSSVHEILVPVLSRLLLEWADAHGAVVGNSPKFLLRTGRGRIPDMFVFFSGRRPRARGAVRIPPDVMIEIVSAELRDVRRDRVEKMDDYAKFGVRFYWIVDPQLRSLEIFARNEQGKYVREIGATSGTIDRIAGCDGLTIDLDAIWAKLDELPEDDVEG